MSILSQNADRGNQTHQDHASEAAAHSALASSRRPTPATARMARHHARDHPRFVGRRSEVGEPTPPCLARSRLSRRVAWSRPVLD